MFTKQMIHSAIFMCSFLLFLFLLCVRRKEICLGSKKAGHPFNQSKAKANHILSYSVSCTRKYHIYYTSILDNFSIPKVCIPKKALPINWPEDLPTMVFIEEKEGVEREAWDFYATLQIMNVQIMVGKTKNRILFLVLIWRSLIQFNRMKYYKGTSKSYAEIPNRNQFHCCYGIMMIS